MPAQSVEMRPLRDDDLAESYQRADRKSPPGVRDNCPGAHSSFPLAGSCEPTEGTSGVYICCVPGHRQAVQMRGEFGCVILPDRPCA